MLVRDRHYVSAPEYAGDRYAVAGWDGIAFYVLGWTTEPDDETYWTGMEERTGQLSVVMVGDDRIHQADPADVTELADGASCRECGQIGCTADGRAE